MPHLTLEFTKNLSGFDAQKALLHMNEAIFGSGHFDEVDIKSRAIPLDCFVIGTSPDNRAFIHARLAVLSNRPPAVRQALSTMLLQELSGLLPEHPGLHVQICVEILEIERDTYSKTVLEAS
jgi:5-carboxymethyl-2-hydroxymuconate isomerase